MIPVILFLILPIILFLTNLFLCSGDLASQDGTLVDDIAALGSYTACTGTPAWLSWVLGILTYGTTAIVLLILFGPLIAGILANPVAGTILAVALAVTAGITAVVAFTGFT